MDLVFFCAFLLICKCPSPSFWGFLLFNSLCYIGSDEHGDRPRALPSVKELNGATDMTERKGSPAWDYDVRS